MDEILLTSAGSMHSVTEPWTLPTDTVGETFGTDTARGLTSAEAARRLGVHGPNALVEEDVPGPWRIFARQFTNTMTVVLAVAALVTLALGDISDTVVISVIVVLNATVGFVQEYRAERAMSALKSMTTGTARVVRDGHLADVPTPELVPGDLVELAAGDVVAADLRLVEVHGLRVNEAALTGEAEPTAKTDDALSDVGSMVGDQANMVFKGTAATFGRGRGIVAATGMDTELGQIAALIQGRSTEQTPLQRRLATLGRRMAAAALFVCAAVFVSGLFRGEPIEELFLVSVSLAVAAIPEGLPAIVTVALALGARRMAEHNAVIRRLPAVETLGSVTVICTDKTGTLTQNRMMVEHVWTPAARYAVSGSGYAPDGALSGDGSPASDPHLRTLATVAAACNDATLHPPTAPDDEWTITGDPTDGALMTLAAKLDVHRADLDRRRPRIAEISFDADRRRMTTVHRDGEQLWVAVKGGLDALRPLLDPADDEAAAEADRAAQVFADEGYRILALAARPAGTLLEPLDELEHGLRLAGLVAIADPPRAGVADAVASCRTAGITPVMITGDHPRTARAIAARLGLLEDDDSHVIVTGDDLDALDDAELGERIVDVRVFARTSPQQKLRIIDAWKARGAVVAMTGDGVNDAPALRQADIGVAMGTIGTDVSKEASDMVLADDDFATIVHAVEEGRRIYDSIRRFVRYLLTTNAGEIWVMFVAPFLGLPLPLLAIQILWINLVTDGLPAVALGMEPTDPDTMNRPPRPPEQSVLAGGLWQHAAWVGLLMAAVILPLQAVSRSADWPWQTMVFTTLALMQLGHALAVRSERRSLFTLGLRSNRWLAWAVAISATAQLSTVYVPALHDVFGTEYLTPLQLFVVLVLSTTAFVAVEIEKLVRRRGTRLGPRALATEPAGAHSRG